MRNRLIQKGGRIPCRPFGGASDQRERIIGDLRAFAAGDLTQERDHHLRFNTTQVEPLTAGQNRHGNLTNFRGRKDELDVGGRFLKRFQERVEGARRQHVNFVDDVDFVAGRGRAVMDRVDDLADVGDACVRCRVHLDHINVATFHDGGAMFALAAGFGRRAALTIKANTVHALCDDPRRGRLTRPADTRHDKGLRDPPCLERILERAHHRVLTDEVGKGFGAVFTGKNLIAGLGRVGHVFLDLLAPPT